MGYGNFPAGSAGAGEKTAKVSLAGHDGVPAVDRELVLVDGNDEVVETGDDAAIIAALEAAPFLMTTTEATRLVAKARELTTVEVGARAQVVLALQYYDTRA